MGHDVESQGTTISYKGGTKYAGNQHSDTMKENYGRGPTKAGTTGDQAGPSTAKGGKIDGGTHIKLPSNPDKQNYDGYITKGNPKHY